MWHIRLMLMIPKIPLETPEFLINFLPVLPPHRPWKEMSRGGREVPNTCRCTTKQTRKSKGDQQQQ
ncbi:hypothetical protein INR49_018716 [Caranx melampygus]|nr:hypothetical protein INR49_018716 [Caranx melampygus]